MLHSHPVSNYYLKPNDLSINIEISFKWILWAYHFFNSISLCIKEDEFNIKYIINPDLLLLWDLSKKIENELFFNDVLICSKQVLINEINSDLYNIGIFNENTSVHFKLKLNLDEFFIISNVYYPTLIYYDII